MDLVPPIDVYRRRWAILAVLCLSLFVVVMDGTIVNVALPSLVTELGATTRQLQWIVDAYLLVFTGLLLAAGSFGDRWGRRRALAGGLTAFVATSVLAGSVHSPAALIASRALMGVGAALIYPATLAVLTNTFSDAKERAGAIGIWSAMSGMAVACGPILGGWLLEHFWWGSVFYVNVPLIALAIVGVLVVVPESKDRSTPPLDLIGLGLSIAAVTTVVFTIIEAPGWGWLSANTTQGALAGGALLAAFVSWELRAPHPMLPVRIFRNLRFSAASGSITSAFFALFGFIFLITQYFQLVRGYSPLQAGVRTIPVAVSIAVASVLSPRLVERIGTKKVVSAGLASMAIGFLWVSTASASYPLHRNRRPDDLPRARAWDDHRPPSRSWVRYQPTRPEWARPSTTPPGNSAVPSASQSSDRYSTRSTSVRSETAPSSPSFPRSPDAPPRTPSEPPASWPSTCPLGSRRPTCMRSPTPSCPAWAWPAWSPPAWPAQAPSSPHGSYPPARKGPKRPQTAPINRSQPHRRSDWVSARSGDAEPFVGAVHDRVGIAGPAVRRCSG